MQWRNLKSISQNSTAVTIDYGIHYLEFLLTWKLFELCPSLNIRPILPEPFKDWHAVISTQHHLNIAKQISNWYGSLPKIKWETSLIQAYCNYSGKQTKIFSTPCIKFSPWIAKPTVARCELGLTWNLGFKIVHMNWFDLDKIGQIKAII